jgi:diguanylate cyclase (GGDEF)-like protein/PAS domain S-box-containing protein
MRIFPVFAFSSADRAGNWRLGGDLAGDGRSARISSAEDAAATVRPEPQAWPASEAGHELMLTCMSNLLSAVEERVYFKDRDSRFLLVSSGWLAAYAPGRTADELVGKTDFDVFGGEHARAAFADEQQIIATGQPVSAKVEEETFSDRASTWASTTKMPLRDENGQIIGTFGISRDITAQVRAEKALAYQALHDPLTGLANRVALMDRLAQALVAMERHRSRLAVLFIDLDNFKEINDAFGHDAGDLVLTEIARRLAGIARRPDTVARLGGDEFVILCPELDEQADPGSIGRRVVGTIAAPYIDNGRNLAVTCSVGIAVTTDPATEPDRMIRDADVTMFEAKRAGRNRYHVCRPGHRVGPATLRAELSRAIQNNELFLAYQPQISLQTRVLAGAEALVRWRHPERGVLLPGSFIPLAEEIGLIGSIDSFVLEEACRQLAQWSGQVGWPQDFTVAVNVSGRKVSGPRLCERVVATLRRHGVRPAQLCLEITETALIQHVGDLQEELSMLSATGVRVALDDFGTGYSTLGYLQQLSADTLKIDRSFVEHISRSYRDQQIVAAVIAMAHALEMTVTGEGVENGDQRSILRLLGCDLGQGNFLAPPLTAAALARRVRSGPGPGNGTVPVSVEAMSNPLVTNDRRTGAPELAPPFVREK